MEAVEVDTVRHECHLGHISSDLSGEKKLEREGVDQEFLRPRTELGDMYGVLA